MGDWSQKCCARPLLARYLPDSYLIVVDLGCGRIFIKFAILVDFNDLGIFIYIFIDFEIFGESSIL